MEKERKVGSSRVVLRSVSHQGMSLASLAGGGLQGQGLDARH